MKFTREQIEVLARHGAERAQMMAEQANARAELEERQQNELAAVGIAAPSQAMLPPQPRQPNGVRTAL